MFRSPLATVLRFPFFALSGFRSVAFGSIFSTTHFDAETDLADVIPHQHMTAEMKALSYGQAPREEGNDNEDHERAGGGEAAPMVALAVAVTAGLQRVIPVVLFHMSESDASPHSLNADSGAPSDA